MTEWRTATIEELTVRTSSGGTPSRKRPEFFADGQGGIPWVRSQELVDRRISSVGEHITDEGLAQSSAKLFPPSTVLVAMYGATVGQLGYLDIEAATNQAICALITDPDATDSRFLYYSLMGARHDLVSQAQGAAQQNLSQAQIRRFSLRVPDLPTQRTLAEVLGSIDDLIENNRCRIEVLEEMAQAIYREWFVHFRYPGREDTTLVDSPLGPIPEGWDVRRASEAMAINPRTKSLKEVEDPFFTMGDISERSLVCFPSEMKDGTSGSKFLNGDTLFARITPCLENGKTGYVAALEEGQVGRGSTEFIVLRGSLVGSAFTYFLARDPDFRGHAIASMSGASGRQRVRNECFDSYELAVPPGDLIDPFERLATPMMAQAFSLARQNQSLIEVRDLLLPKLVTGEIDVSPLDLGALVGAS